MAVTTGRNSTRIQKDLVKRSVLLRDKIFQNSKLSPLYSLLLQNGKVIEEDNGKFEWVRTKLNSPVFKVAPAGDSDTTLTVVDDSRIKADFLEIGSIIKCKKTGEQMRVTNIENKTLTVTREYGITTKQAIVQDDGTNATFIVLARIFEEGSKAPEGTIITRETIYNYCQIFRKTLNITRRKLEQKGYADDGETAEAKRVAERNKILRLHQNDIENALLLGEMKFDNTGEEDAYLTGGVMQFIQTNVETITQADKFKVGTITEMLGKMADKQASGDKILLCGSGFLNKLNDNAIKTFAGGAGAVLEKYGVAVKSITTDYGNLDIMYDPILSNIYNNTGIFLDMDNIYLHSIKETTLETNIQTEGYDGIKDTYLTDVGLEITNEETCGILNLEF